MQYKYLGQLNEKLAKQLGLLEHQNKPILVFNDRIEHVKERHLKDFGSEKIIEDVYLQLPNIIKKPDYAFYNEKTKGIELYKKLDNNICVAIRVNKGNSLKVRSWYPVKQIKIANRIKKLEERDLD